LKVAVQCESALLQRSVELFLDKHLSSLKQCDIVIRDTKVMDAYHSLYISSEKDSDLVKPFSRSQLFLSLENFYNKIVQIQSVKDYDEDVMNSNSSQSQTTNPYLVLEERIEALTQEYKNNIMKMVKDFYE